jgi:hypothetical protein
MKDEDDNLIGIYNIKNKKDLKYLSNKYTITFDEKFEIKCNLPNYSTVIFIYIREYGYYYEYCRAKIKNKKCISDICDNSCNIEKMIILSDEIRKIKLEEILK